MRNRAALAVVVVATSLAPLVAGGAAHAGTDDGTQASSLPRRRHRLLGVRGRAVQAVGRDHAG